MSTTPGVQIRRARNVDLPAILTLYADPELDDGVVLELPEAESIFERMATYPNYALYVAERDGEIVGTFALLIMDNLAHLGAPSGVVEDVVVRASERGRGIGKTMLQHAMAECRRQGCYKLALSVNRKRTAAHSFYESLGFERHGYSFVVPLGKPPGQRTRSTPS